MRVTTAGRAARGGLGERHAPALARRRAREHPGPPVEVDELVVVDVAGEVDPALGAGLVDLGLELLAAVALADDHRLERRGARACSRTSASMSSSKRFTGTSRPTATTSGVGDFVAAGREPRVDARRDDVHEVVA